MILPWKFKKDGDDVSANVLIFFFNSEENLDLNSFRVASPLLTSTQKSNMTQSSGKFSDEDSPLDISDLAVTKPTKRYCVKPVSILLHNVLDWF